MKRLPLFFSLAFLGICLWLSGPLRAGAPHVPEIPADDISLRWDPLLFKFLTFGQYTSALDALWIRTLQDSSSEHVTGNLHARAYWDLMLFTDLDPAFFEVYVAGGTLLTVVRNDNAGARDLLDRGEHFRESELTKFPEKFQNHFWPHPWQIPLLLSYIYIFELNDFHKGAESFREAASVSGSPSYLQELVKRLNRPQGEYEVALKLVDFLIQSTKDDRMEEVLQKKKADLIIAEFINRAQMAFDSKKTNWNKFIQSEPSWSRDPEGGALSVENGKVVTSTPYSPVFGLH